MSEEVSDQVGGGLDYSFAMASTLKKDPFQDKKYNVGKHEEENTQVNAPGSYALSAEKSEELARFTAEKEQNSAQNFINDGSSSLSSISSAAGSNTVTPKDGEIIDGKMYIEGRAYTMQAGIAPLPGIGKFNIKEFFNFFKNIKSLFKFVSLFKTTKVLPYVIQQIEGFYIRSSTVFSRGVYTRNIQSLASLNEGTSIAKLLSAFEVEAKAMGANKVIINGVDIINPKLFNATVAQRFGYSFKQTSNNSIQLIKKIK